MSKKDMVADENAALRAEVEQAYERGCKLWHFLTKAYLFRDVQQDVIREMETEIEKLEAEYAKWTAALDYWFEYGGWGTERRDINDEVPTYSDYSSCSAWLAALVAAHTESQKDAG